MRLSTESSRDHSRGLAVVHAALDAGARLLDTADAYCLDDTETGHNERLIAEALRTWTGDRAAVTVATKGGLRRPRGQWVPDGRATQLRAACNASCRALGVDTIDLYQLHVVDPRTPLETSLRALAALQQEGRIKRIGLCNVNVHQIEQARALVDVATVQVNLGVLDAENLRNGVAEYCCENGILLLAYRPLGGVKGAARIAKDAVLRDIAGQHKVTPHDVALAWLLSLHPLIVPLPGATREENARAISRVRALQLSGADRAALDAHLPAGLLLRSPRAARRPPATAPGEVVLVMGLPGAGKSTVAGEFVARGFMRLNRDARGGTLRDLVPLLEQTLASGTRQVVLDNTYAARAARNEVIEAAWRQGVPVRCVWLKTALADAQINAVGRLLEAHGRLPMPEELRALGRSDHRYFGPDAQFRYERELEPPSPAEGFSAVEERVFIRKHGSARGPALIVEYDDVLCTGVPLAPAEVALAPGMRAALQQYRAEGWPLLALAWRPQIAAGRTTAEQVQACFQRTRELLGCEIDIRCCPHAAGPPVCWCRKPLPGLVLAFCLQHDSEPAQSHMIGRSAADRTLAARLGMTYHGAESPPTPAARRYHR